MEKQPHCSLESAVLSHFFLLTHTRSDLIYEYILHLRSEYSDAMWFAGSMILGIPVVVVTVTTLDLCAGSLTRAPCNRNDGPVSSSRTITTGSTMAVPWQTNCERLKI